MYSKSQLQENTMRNIRPVGLSVLIGVAVCVVFLLLMSAVLSSQNVPQSLISPMAIFSLSVGAFVAGYSCAKIMRERGLLYGTVCGAALSMILLIASFAVSDSGFGLLALLKIAFIMLSSMFGGVMGVNARSRKR